MKNIDVGHYILIITTVLGFIFGIWQFLLKRKFEKRDKLADRRYEAYKSFMALADEIGNKVRTDPNNVFSITDKYFNKILSDDLTVNQTSLNEFNSEIFEYTKKNLEPLQIVNAELNKLKLVCGIKMLSKIEEYKQLIEYFSNITTSNMDLMVNDPNKYYEIMANLIESEQSKRMSTLWTEILELMRLEINNFN